MEVVASYVTVNIKMAGIILVEIINVIGARITGFISTSIISGNSYYS